jgi:hypothetical protein
MRLLSWVKLLGELLGFLLVSIGGTLFCIGVLLLLSHIVAGHGDTSPLVQWLGLVLSSGLSGITMVAAGIWLVRRFKA